MQPLSGLAIAQTSLASLPSLANLTMRSKRKRSIRHVHPLRGAKEKKHGKIEQSGETPDNCKESNLCKKMANDNNNHGDGADHDADAAMMRLTTMTAMTVMMMR